MCRFRKLEQLLIERFDGAVSDDRVVEELSEYQNGDGGFGRGLEPDFMLPDSSAMATSIGLRILHGLDSSEIRDEMIAKAVGYLWATYDDVRCGWWAVPEEVNEHPHAPWWQWSPVERMTVIDRSWGNPNAELIGYLSLYSQNPKVVELIDFAFDYFESLTEYKSDHELFCFIKFCELVSDQRVERLKAKLRKAVAENIVYDEKRWIEYVPKPLDFLRFASSNWLGIDEGAIRSNLKMLKRQIDQKGFVEVNWSWGSDEKNWEISKCHWRGVLTLEAIGLKKRYGELILKKTIGILAGMGPRSTAPFLESLLDECQRQYGAAVDMDFPKMVMISLPTPFYLDRTIDEIKLKQAIVDGAKELSGYNVDYMVIPCNTAHLYMESIAEAVPIPVLDMVELTVGRIKDRRCALLAAPLTVDSGLFQRKDDRIEWISNWQSQVNDLIAGVKSGVDIEWLQGRWNSLLEEIKGTGCRQVVIGCTDLSVFSNSVEEMVVIDAMGVLAEETVKEWLG